MRLLLFFDLPTITSHDLKEYRHFRRNIIKSGFYMVQESVYVKMVLNYQNAESSVNQLKRIIPKNGNIIVLTITEKQFSSMEILLGEFKTDVITTDERVVVL